MTMTNFGLFVFNYIENMLYAEASNLEAQGRTIFFGESAMYVVNDSVFQVAGENSW